MPKFAVIMPAAGKSRRFKDKHYKKPFATLDKRAVWLHSAEKFLNRDDVIQLILVIAEDDRESFEMKFAANVAILGIDVVDGGKERADSIEKALAHVKPEADFVAVHDAARPCIVDEWIATLFEAAEKSGAALFALPVTATLKRVRDQNIVKETIDRKGLWEAQTPQVFRRELLLEAYARRNGCVATDDAQLVEQIGHEVTVVEGSPLNRKITNKQDLRLAAQILKVLPKPRTGGTGNPFADDDFFR
ncbi:MAG: 2-C-methyl-D-erythritol 4-phosphate cytidylyltransferase [Pirellulales bacterium]|jgi:2-C-methyl-D-erythritol 4-phosphate cytidylyltransferase|nr:2-C-methyl-D-erythritol 4-phosphate cytidylyltransferase [Pirellulales bacterium]